MKVDRLETHDRLKEFVEKDFLIGECAQDLINQMPFGNRPFYIFAHARTETREDGTQYTRLIWQPRLGKPEAQTNSMLFKVYPGSDYLKIIWMIPKRELWKQYQIGNMTENQKVLESIYDFTNNRDKLEAKEEDDLSDERINQIYKEISQEAKRKKCLENATSAGIIL